MDLMVVFFTVFLYSTTAVAAMKPGRDISVVMDDHGCYGKESTFRMV